MQRILGVRIDNLNRREILEKTAFFLSEKKFHQIATVGPEFVLLAQKDEKFRDILNRCDLNVADGVGIWFAFIRYFSFLKTRFTGVDLMMKILKMAEKRGLGVFLAARKDGLSSWKETRDAILKIYPKLNIAGENYDISVIASEAWQSRADNFGIASSQTPRKDILFCNFGAPHQEYFINSVKNDTIRLAMGVGGSFDFLTGKIKRAPKILRRFGFEWLWRLFQQPNRWKRIFRAAVVFPIKVILCREK